MATRNFDPAIDKKLTCGCGSDSCDRRTVDQGTLEKLQIIRDRINKAMPINSGARCPFHEKEVGRTDTDHQSCKAADVRADKLTARRIALEAVRIGATAVGFYEWGVHLFFGEGDRLRVWIDE